jgi:hypothetical protein
MQFFVAVRVLMAGQLRQELAFEQVWHYAMQGWHELLTPSS